LADIHIGEKLTELLPAIIPAHWGMDGWGSPKKLSITSYT
jgi:hypothetical protein